MLAIDQALDGQVSQSHCSAIDISETNTMTEFNVRFAVHLGQAKISNLKGILLVKGIAVGGDDLNLAFQVYRPNRVSDVAITLNNWAASGWVNEWSSTQPLSIAEKS